MDITSYLLGKKASGGGENKPDWSTIGYENTPSGIIDIYDYSLQIKNNWVSVSDLSNKFQNDTNLEIMPLVDTSQATTVSSMFSGCINLKNIPLLDFSSVQQFTYFVNGCKNLKTIPLLDISNVSSIANSFASCTNLTSIPQLNTLNIYNFQNAFSGCTNLTTVPILNTSSAGNLRNMFNSCPNLTDESLNNVLQMCINATSYTGTKTLAYLGFNNTNYSATRIQALSHYQDFINAGWTIGY